MQYIDYENSAVTYGQSCQYLADLKTTECLSGMRRLAPFLFTHPFLGRQARACWKMVRLCLKAVCLSRSGARENLSRSEKMNWLLVILMNHFFIFFSVYVCAMWECASVCMYVCVCICQCLFEEVIWVYAWRWVSVEFFW